MEVALYVRVSTSRQQQQQTIEQQLSRLRDYVATHPDWHVAEEHIYRDDGYSGATLKRPGLDRLRDQGHSVILTLLVGAVDTARIPLTLPFYVFGSFSGGFLVYPP